MSHFSLLSVILFLPLLGALFLLFIRGDERVTAANSRYVARLITVCTFLMSLAAWASYADKGVPNAFFIERNWLPSFSVGWRVDLDDLSLIFVLLISFLSMLSVCAGRKSISSMVREFMFLTLVLESFMLIAVCARDLFQFFVFYEAAVLPLFLMISVWGVERRAFTAFKFCFYMLAGSVFLLTAVFILYLNAGSADFAALKTIELSEELQLAVLVCLAGALAFKAPLVPFHAWLSDAQAEAPMPAAVLLSGVFSKLVFYAFLRLALPATGALLERAGDILLVWAVFSSLYGALITLMQEDMKKIAGFTHLTQAGFLTAGLVCLTPVSLEGMLFLCAAQGLAMAAYLISSGALYERFAAGNIKEPSGIIVLFPYLGTAFFISCLALLAVPPLMPFAGEFLIFKGVFVESAGAAFVVLAASALLFAAFFRMFARLLFGEPPVPVVVVPDMSWREKVIGGLFGIVFIILSVMPETVFSLAVQAVASLSLR